MGHHATVHLLVVVLLALPATARAEPPRRPEEPGPFAVKTLEFPDLRDAGRAGRRVPIKVHLPEANGRLPVVVFSHGGGGSWDANYAQAQHLASHGFAVLCLEHAGSNTARLTAGLRFAKNLKAMTRDAEEVLGRPLDVRFALDTAAAWDRSHPELSGRLDTARAGALGHSFGAFTVLAACGARPALDWLTPAVGPGKGLGPDLSDPRIAACVALSPQGPGEPFFLESSYAGLSRPVLGISGSLDRQQGAPPENRRRFFELSPPGGKVFIWLDGADHMTFSDPTGSGRRSLPSRSRRDAQPLVRAATLLFFDAHLRSSGKTEDTLSAKALRPLLRGAVDGMEILKK
jgi:predicted dienelactone hydrolase